MVLRHLWSVAVVLAATLTLVLANPSAAQDPCLLDPPDPSCFVVSVNPKGDPVTRPPNTTGLSESFTIFNEGTHSDGYTLTCSRTGSVQCGPNPAPVTLQPGTFVIVSVQYSTTAIGTGTLTLTASSTTGAVDQGFYNVTVGTFGVAVTPDGTPTPTRSSNSSGFIDTFTVRNAGSSPDTYTITCGGSGVTCTGASPGSITNLGPGASQLATAQYSTGAVGTGTLTLTATSTHATDGGSRSVPIVKAAVAVTPDGATDPQRRSAEAYTDTFTVHNTGTGMATFAITATCPGVAFAAGCTPSPSSLPVGGGLSAFVNVSYTAGTAGSTGRVTVRATQSADASVLDTGWVTLTVGTAQKPVVDVASVNAGTTRERGLCLTIAAGAAAAAECGDLRIVHPLPSVRTLNKLRTPTLIYNSAEARPYPLVAANVSLPATAANPDTVYATLKTGGVTRGTAKWMGADWKVGSASRIVVADTTNPDTTGVYAYTLIVTNWWNGASALADTQPVKVAVVARQKSPFGAGWWLAGVERLYVGSMLWVGGDGSTRQYASVATQAMTNCLTGQPSPANNVYAAPNVDRLDTLKFDGGCYTRYLPHGAQVRFDQQGRHIATLNRLGHVTKFGYKGTTDTLLADTLPPGGVTYQFSYTPGQRWVVTAPSNPGQTRADTGTISAGRLTVLRGPDTSRVSFAYFAGSDSNLVQSRTDRRRVATSYTLDATKKLIQSSVGMGAGQPAIVRQWRPLETLGYPGVAGVHAIDTAVAYTRYDGPRVPGDVGDTTLFWLDRFGAPRRVVNALGFATLLTRGDSRWPALVTEVRAPNGLVTQATYDTHGNILTSTVLNPLADGRNAPTRYEWDPAWDFVTKVVPPERDSIVLTYTANGNRLYQQDARGTTGRTEFFYYTTGVAAGLLSSVRTPGQTLGGPRDSIEYGTFGNLSRTKTPLGFWTSHVTDAVGRDTLIMRPTDSAQTSAYQQRQRTVYDLSDRDTLAIGVGPSLPYRADPHGFPGDSLRTQPETLVVRKVFDPEGNLLSVRRWARPNLAGIDTLLTTSYRYDSAGRKVKEIAPDGLADSTAYDLAGNPIAQVTRLNDTLTLSYDPLNRLLRRATRQKDYAYVPVQPVAGGVVWHFPMYRADASGELNTANGTGGTFGLTIAADTALFTYDSLSSIRTANNRDAKITRTYNPNGTLATETQSLRTYVGSDFTQHTYQLRYSYDLNGRRTQLVHPANLVPVGAVPVAYHYDVIGQLDTLHNVLGGVHTYAYDLDGRTIRTTGDVTEQGFYDADDRLIRREDTFHFDTLRYDARGKVVRTRTNADSTVTRYAGLGAVAWSQTLRYANAGTHPEEHYVTDALGNTAAVYRRTNGIQDLETAQGSRYTYETTTGRLLEVAAGDSGATAAVDITQSSYDATGNRRSYAHVVSTSFNSQFATLIEKTLNYHGADGKLRVVDRRSCLFDPNNVCQTTWSPDFNDRQAFEEYRYDALGRRVLLRTRGEWGCTTSGCRKLDQRFVWDGDQLLYEISAPGGTGESAANMERDVNQPLPAQSAASTHYTGRVAYTHGLALDAPLNLFRMEYSDSFPGPFGVTPAATWRGDYDTGTGLPCKTFIQVGPREQDTTFVQVCAQVQWPAAYLWLTKLARQRGNGPVSWMGSLIEGKRDLTGQIYMRNRYYDPASGRFTQEDPLGLAGGLNLYAFAKGDPVNFSDPFGLCPYAGLKRTISLADCPKDERLDAFKVMEKTKMGRYFIQQFTIGRLNLELHAGTVQCGSHANANGCSNHLQGTMVINSSQSASAIASAVVHETMHWIVWGASAFVQNHITIGSFVGDEMPAYAAGWTFYNGLPQGLRNDAGLNYIAGMYRTDPATAMRMQCLWSVYDGCGDW